MTSIQSGMGIGEPASQGRLFSDPTVTDTVPLIDPGPRIALERHRKEIEGGQLEMTTPHWHYFRHDPSGEVYAISVGDNGMFGDISISLHHSELTPENLVNGFDYDEDDQEWMGSQTWQMIGPDNPNCDCPPKLKPVLEDS